MKHFQSVFVFFFLALAAWGQNAETIRKAKAGDIKAQGELTTHYYYSAGSYKKAAKWAKPAAEAGDAQAQSVLACLYMYGQGGLPKNKELAFKWAHSAAAQGHETAMFCLGLWYSDVNKQEAIYWFKKDMDIHYQKYGKENDNAAKQLESLGVCYHPGVSHDTTSDSSSISLSSLMTKLNLALDVQLAKAGDIESQGKLARYCYDSEAYEGAVKWAKSAADAGDAQAQYVLAYLYVDGKGGLPKNGELSFKWMYRAAAQGYYDAMFDLGMSYKAQNKQQEAIYWFKKVMDACYQKYGEEDEDAAEELESLGVYYHPDSNRNAAGQ